MSGDANDFEPPPPGQFGLTTLLLVITFACVVFGLAASDPGAAIGLAILSLPAFLRTAILHRRRSALGRKTSTGQSIVSFVGSLVTAVVGLGVVAVASVGTFCLVCITTAGAVRSRDSSPFIFATIAGIAATAFVVWILVTIARARWRHDVDKD